MDPEILVLLSGGIDSSACVNFYCELGRPVSGLFIDYGQPAASEEIRSAVAIAQHYSIPLKRLALRGRKAKSEGFIHGRNLFLVAVAIMEGPPTVSAIAIGIHSGTNYPDCSKSFLARLQTVLNLLEPGKLHLAAPFLTWSKPAIYEYCLDRRVPIDLTYSCERGGAKPCRKCLSCKDRELLHACSPIHP